MTLATAKILTMMACPALVSQILILLPLTVVAQQSSSGVDFRGVRGAILI